MLQFYFGGEGEAVDDPSMQKFAVSGLMKAVWDCMIDSEFWNDCQAAATKAPEQGFGTSTSLSLGRWEMNLNLRRNAVRWVFTFDDRSLGSLIFSFRYPSFMPQAIDWILGEGNNRRGGWGSPVFMPMAMALQSACREYVTRNELPAQGRGVLVRTLFLQV